MISALRHLGVTSAEWPTVEPIRAVSPPIEIRAHQPSFRARLAAAYYCFTFGLFTWLWVTIFFLSFFQPLLLLPAATYVAYILGPGRHATNDGSWPKPLRRVRAWRWLASYFPQAKLHKTADLPPDKAYIFGQHPHGILAFGTWLGFGVDALGFPELFPGVDVHVTTLNINFRAPILREYLMLLGVVPVEKPCILKLLSAGKSVTITVGGSTESLLTQPGRYDLVLRRRRGFVRCALQTGASLVPCISFGEPETYTTANALPHGHPIRRFQRWLERTAGFTLPVAFGRGVFLPWGLLPWPVPLNVVVGAPIDVERWEGEPGGAAFEAMVDKYHKLYVSALMKLFEDHKERFAKGAADMQLVE